MQPQPYAKVIADSISEEGIRLTTLEVCFHRFVLAEFNTHRAFSRNSASSRAISITSTLDKFKDGPAYPLKWGAEQVGMQSGGELEGRYLDDALRLWNTCFSFTYEQVFEYVGGHPDKETRLHKSLLNRLLEPFAMHTAIITSTEWDNFFAQRSTPEGGETGAQAEIQVPADLMKDALSKSWPEMLTENHWHLPYVKDDEFGEFEEEILCKISIARCARVSYLTQARVRDPEEDINLFNRLITADPPHWSPTEHVARPDLNNIQLSVLDENGEIVPLPRVGNFLQWRQFRHNNLILK